MAEWSGSSRTGERVLFVSTLYAAAFFMPAYQVGECPFFGWEAFSIEAREVRNWIREGRVRFLGVPAPFTDPVRPILGAVAWLANPAFGAGVVLLATGRGRGAGAAGIVALLLGALWLLLLNPARFCSGYCFWLASMGALAVVGFQSHDEGGPHRTSPPA